MWEGGIFPHNMQASSTGGATSNIKSYLINTNNQQIIISSEEKRFRGVLSVRTRREARQKMLQRKTAELLNEDDLHKLLEPLRKAAKKTTNSSVILNSNRNNNPNSSNSTEQEVIDYASFKAVYKHVLEECVRAAEYNAQMNGEDFDASMTKALYERYWI